MLVFICDKIGAKQCKGSVNVHDPVCDISVVLRILSRIMFTHK